MAKAAVIGAGPAGLMVAEMLLDQGIVTTLVDAKPTVGRKLLMAGKSGLNLTKDEGFDDFIGHYDEASDWLRPILGDFSNSDVQDWARDLGQQVFTGSTGRVFLTSMKSSPLVRAWMARLVAKGLILKTRWRWTGWKSDELAFETPDAPKTMAPGATILALGGASWPRLGSDGGWADHLSGKGIKLTDFQPANMGFNVNWSDHMKPFFGRPVKACLLKAGNNHQRGEFVISATGFEGGGIYSVSKTLRGGASLTLDLLPDLKLETVASRLSKPRGKTSLGNHLRKTIGLDPVRLALLQEFARPLPSAPVALAKIIKNLPVPLGPARPIAEAISTAGGVPKSELTDGLMLKTLPGVFCSGEMLDWEAPTGGYLLTACLATGRWAGLSAARFLSADKNSD